MLLLLQLRDLNEMKLSKSTQYIFKQSSKHSRKKKNYIQALFCDPIFSEIHVSHLSDS